MTATARRPDAETPAVSSAALGLRVAARATGRPATTARREKPPAIEMKPRGGAVAIAAPAVRRASPPASLARRAPALALPAVRHARPAALRVQRRARAPWHLLPRDRLAAAWAGVQGARRAAESDLHLVGVYGPLPLGAVERVRLEPDGRLSVTLGRGRGEPVGDIALARHPSTQRLMRCDVPHPSYSRPRRRLR